MAKENLAEMPENYDMMDEVKASAVMNETEEQKIVASNVNDNQEGENPPSPKGGAATKAVEENTVNENARDISQPLTVEDIVKSKQLSPEMLAEIINAAKNDNLFPVDNLDGKELTDKINELHEWVNAEESRLKSIPFSIELYNQKKAVLQARAAYVLILECLIGEKLREIPRQNGTNENSESRASGETRTKSQIIKEEYGLSPRLARDFQHLTWDGVKAAIGLAFKQKDIPTRALALSKSASIKANQNKHNKGLKHTKFVLDYIEETEAKTLELEKPMYITTLFSNISIGLARIHELNLHCRVAAEWDKTRAHWHELLYPDCHMVQGDFTSDKCFNEALEWHKKQGCDIIMASCCCEPFSNLNNSPNKGDVPEAKQFYYAADFILKAKPKYFVFENVPGFVDARPKIAHDILKNKDGKGLKIIKDFSIDESSTKGERKQYHEMLDFAKSCPGKVAIVVNYVDRLQRNYDDTYELNKLRKEGKIEVHFLREQLIIHKDSNSLEINFWNMHVLMANAQVNNMIDKVKASQAKNWSLGKCQGYAPLGYLNTKDENYRST